MTRIVFECDRGCRPPLPPRRDRPRCRRRRRGFVFEIDRRRPPLRRDRLRRHRLRTFVFGTIVVVVVVVISLSCSIVLS